MKAINTLSCDFVSGIFHCIEWNDIESSHQSFSEKNELNPCNIFYSFLVFQRMMYFCFFFLKLFWHVILILESIWSYERSCRFQKVPLWLWNSCQCLQVHTRTFTTTITYILIGTRKYKNYNFSSLKKNYNVLNTLCIRIILSFEIHWWLGADNTRQMYICRGLTMFKSKDLFG